MAHPANIDTVPLGGAQPEKIMQRMPQTATWLACMSPSQRYLFALKHTGEIIRGATVTKVPYTHAWFRGLINVRGQLHGVIDLPDFLAVHRGASPPAAVGPRRPTNQESACILTLGATLGLHCGLVVGQLEGLRSAGDFQSIANQPDKYGPLISGVYRDGSDSPWLEINLVDLVASALTRSISLEQASL